MFASWCQINPQPSLVLERSTQCPSSVSSVLNFKFFFFFTSTNPRLMGLPPRLVLQTLQAHSFLSLDQTPRPSGATCRARCSRRSWSTPPAQEESWDHRNFHVEAQSRLLRRNQTFDTVQKPANQPASLESVSHQTDSELSCDSDQALTTCTIILSIAELHGL